MEADIERCRTCSKRIPTGTVLFVCEYEIFKQFLPAAAPAERYNGTMFLALLTISNTYEQRFDKSCAG
ncbi:MAG: hypothetical protein R2912_00535 [Eubacteriales bacterium]